MHRRAFLSATLLTAAGLALPGGGAVDLTWVPRAIDALTGDVRLRRSDGSYFLFAQVPATRLGDHAVQFPPCVVQAHAVETFVACEARLPWLGAEWVSIAGGFPVTLCHAETLTLSWPGASVSWVEL